MFHVKHGGIKMRSEIVLCDICKKPTLKGHVNLDCYRVDSCGSYRYTLTNKELCTNCADNIITLLDKLVEQEEL